MEEPLLILCKSLNQNRVKYMVIGGMACLLYGSPRLTKDIDIIIDPTISNARRLLTSLKKINFGTAELTTPEKILKNEINIFKDYFRVDVLTSVKGIDFKNSYKRKVNKKIKGVRIPLINFNDLIASKKLSRREIDRQDIEILRKIKHFKKGNF